MSSDGDRDPNRDTDTPFSFEIFSPFNISLGPGMGPQRVISIQFPSNSNRGDRRNAALEAILSNLFMGRGADDLDNDVAFDPLSYIAARSFAMAMNEVNTNPVHQSVIDSLKKIDVTEKHVGDGAACPVCLDDFAIGEEGVYSLPCDHMFHKETCLLPWLKSHNSCPVCRKEFLSARDGPQTREPGQEESSGHIQTEANATTPDDRATDQPGGNSRNANANFGLNLLRMIGLPIPERVSERPAERAAERTAERPRISIRTTFERIIQPSTPGVDSASATTTDQGNPNASTATSPSNDPEPIFRRSAHPSTPHEALPIDPLQPALRMWRGQSARQANENSAENLTADRIAPEPVRSRTFNTVQVEPVVIQIGRRNSDSTTTTNTTSGPFAESQSIPNSRAQEVQESPNAPSDEPPRSPTAEARSPVDFFVQMAQSLLARGAGAFNTSPSESTAAPGTAPSQPPRSSNRRAAANERYQRTAFPPFPFFVPLQEAFQPAPFAAPPTIHRPAPAPEIRVTEDGFLEEDILRAIAASLEESGPSTNNNEESNASSTSSTTGTGSTSTNTRQSVSNPNNVLRISRANLPQADFSVIELATPQPTPVPTTVDLSSSVHSLVAECEEGETDSVVTEESDDEAIVSIPLSSHRFRNVAPRIFITPQRMSANLSMTESPVQISVTHSSPRTAGVETTQLHSLLESGLHRSLLGQTASESRTSVDTTVIPIQSGAGGCDSDHSHGSAYSSLSNKRERDELQTREVELLYNAESSNLHTDKGYVVGSNNSRSRTDVAQSTLDAVRNAIREDAAPRSSRGLTSILPNEQSNSLHYLSGFQTPNVTYVEGKRTSTPEFEDIAIHTAASQIDIGKESRSFIDCEVVASPSGINFSDLENRSNIAVCPHANSSQDTSPLHRGNSALRQPLVTNSPINPLAADVLQSSNIVQNDTGEEKESAMDFYPIALASSHRQDQEQCTTSSPSVSVSSNSPLVGEIGANMRSGDDKNGSCIARTGGSLMNRINNSMSPLVDRLKNRFRRNRE